MTVKIVGILLFFSTVVWAGSPDWINQSGRQMIAGDIVHWGTGDASTPDIALFKARHMAIKTLIEECGGVANKDIIPRKSYVEPNGYSYRAYALVSLDFSSCDFAKTSEGKRIENPELVKAQKLYNKLVFDEQDEKKPEEPKPDERESLYEIQRLIREDIRDGASARESQMQRLQNEIGALRAEIARPIYPVKLPSTSSMRVACESRYQAMMATITMHAASYHGNMAAPQLNNELGGLEQQKQLCQRME